MGELEALHTSPRVGAAAPANDAEPDIDFTAVSASLALARSDPALSAMPGLFRAPAPRWASVVALGGISLLIEPSVALPLLSVAAFCTFCCLVAWRAILLFVATAPGARQQRANGPAQPLSPVYTVLVPLYREAAAVPGLARAMNRLDWPRERLDLILLLESGDTETIETVAAETWPSGTRTLILPPGAPQTKPRALNYGLAHARGAITCVYDAEDRPHPKQLRAAHKAFISGQADLACVQAPLAAHNARESWLANQWAIEYAVQFGLLLTAQSRLRLPLLLGGTSNHFPTELLRRVNGWDAWNVTEDADLGVRLARLGLRSAMISPPTFEEAPESLRIWIAQRSRWLKGFWQTWLVLMRDVTGARRAIGTLGFLSLQISLLGTCLAALAHAPLAAFFLYTALTDLALSKTGLALVLAGYGINALAVLAAPGPKGLRRWLGVLTLPFYWPLHTLAAIRALYGWVRSPHFWAKTPHGLSASDI